MFCRMVSRISSILVDLTTCWIEDGKLKDGWQVMAGAAGIQAPLASRRLVPGTAATQPRIGCLQPAAAAPGHARQHPPAPAPVSTHFLAGARVGDVELVLVAGLDLGAPDVEAQRLERRNLRRRDETSSSISGGAQRPLHRPQPAAEQS